MSGLQLAAIGGGVFLAAATQQLAGFGFGLVAVSVMSLVVGPKEAVALAAVSGAAASLLMALRLRGLADRPVVRRLLIGAVIGMPIGIVGLRRLPEDPLRVMVAVAVLVTVAILASGYRLRSEQPRTELGAGLLAGMMNTSIGVGGPPVVLVLQAAETEQHAFRATAVAFFAMANLVAVPLIVASGAVSTSTWAASVVVVPAALVGTLAFERIAYRVAASHFRPLVLGLLVVTSAASIASVVL